MVEIGSSQPKIELWKKRERASANHCVPFPFDGMLLVLLVWRVFEE